MKLNKEAGKKKIPIYTVQVAAPGTDVASVLLSQWAGKKMPRNVQAQVNALINKVRIIINNLDQQQKIMQETQFQRRLMHAIASDTGGAFHAADVSNARVELFPESILQKAFRAGR